MYAARVAAAVAILLNLALLNVLLEAKGTKLGYACARKQEAARAASLEQRRLLLEASRGRAPEKVMEKATQHGVILEPPRSREPGSR
jgi:hypothetical protein